VAVFQMNAEGRWSRMPAQGLADPLPDDSSGIVGWTPAPGIRSLLIGLASYENKPGKIPSLLRYDFVNGTLEPGPPLPAFASSAGPLAVADINGNGSLDLVVGGRFVPGRYPEAASTRVFRNEGGNLVLDEENSRRLEGVGLVSAALFSDLNGDGFPELILACEWGPIRIFLNEGGTFTDATEQFGLDRYHGLWNSVATGDFTGDGRMDIVAGNLGLNSYKQRAPEGPWYLLYGDFTGDGQVNLIEAYMHQEKNELKPWRHRDVVAAEILEVVTRFPTHRAYGKAGAFEIIGRDKSGVSQVKADTLESMLFLNRGGHFEAAPLPKEAQWSPAMGLAVADADGDGHEDLFISQNFFAVRQEDQPLASGRGLWLKGDGEGGFSPMPGQESGIRIYGEQRGAALADFDGDGRVDLVVTQNAGQTRLFRNAGASPGLRVRLNGPPGNPDGIGAVMRLKFGETHGPSREVQAGSGYWSQHSAVQVLGMPSAPSEIEIRWPGGHVTSSLLPEGATEIEVDATGALKVVKQDTSK
jgi:enediyne biosynthesis protein E4